MDEKLSDRAEVIPLHHPPTPERGGRTTSARRKGPSRSSVTSRRRPSRDQHRLDRPMPVEGDTHAGTPTVSSWLTRREAADYMGVHPRTLANWAAAGRGPRYSKPSGSSCMYRLDDLDAYLQSHMVHTDDQPEAA